MARNVLSQKQRFQLTNYVQENYEKFALSDRIFAEEATKNLGFEVNANHVDAARDVLEIPATKMVKAAPVLLIERVELLEKRLARAEELLNQLAAKIK